MKLTHSLKESFSNSFVDVPTSPFSCSVSESPRSTFCKKIRNSRLSDANARQTAR